MPDERIPLSRTFKRTEGTRDASGLVPRTHLFLVCECARLGAGGARWSLDGIDQIVVGRGADRSVERSGRTLTVRVPDGEMSKAHVRFSRLMGGFVLEDVGSTNGTKLAGTRVTTQSFLAEGALVEAGGTFFTIETRPTAKDASDDDGSVSTLAPDYAHALGLLDRVASTALPVLLRGESGTGKDVLARAIHAGSRRKGAFVPVNCGAIPDTLVESQLFGHTKGAFSGAVRDEPGLVRASDGGTLFLDEIGDLPKTSQAALLRVLQESEVTSVGTTRAVKVDLRVVSATHKSIEEGGEFRQDLYARLAGFTHFLPPLRERRCDIGLLIGALLRDLAPDRAERTRLAPDACAALLAYDYPLNVRELRHALQAALVFAEDVLALAHLPEAVRTPSPKTVPRSATLSTDDEKLRAELVASLEEHKGNISEISRAFGKTRMQIHRWMKRFGIDPATYR
jgi:transcriptional regulator with GAF, ATPase, and Fis domain